MQLTEELASEVRNALENMIISTSGWRKVFAADGAESSSPEVSLADKILSGCAALATVRILKPSRRILLATDSRPTGKQLAACVSSVFAALGISFTYLGISAAPEAMAESRREEFAYFFYISASHNPIGHNGFKFGSDGGVFDKSAEQPIADEFRRICSSEKDLAWVLENLAGQEPAASGKTRAVSDYKDFVLRTAAGSKAAVESFKKQMKSKLDIGIAIDFNGSARCLSADLPLMDELGIAHVEINSDPAKIAHAIVPEAENLDFCRRLLEEQHKKDSRFMLGYMPDNDGDRGNLVYIDDDGQARIMAAQTVFALITLAELAASAKDNLAVAANGPTSMRIDEICSHFGAKCFRSEVGEANAVSLAEKLRAGGFNVPLCGEGSNGGCIIHPSKVRDPLNSVLSLLKLLSSPQALSSWLGKPQCTVAELVASLPVYTTTDAFSPLAGMKVGTNDFSAFKDRFEDLWDEAFPTLAELGIVRCVEFQLEGTDCVQARGKAGRSGGCRGGLKYLLYDKNDCLMGFTWMRPSGTEPLLRLLVDLKGDAPELHDRLLAHMRNLIQKTDAGL